MAIRGSGVRLYVDTQEARGGCIRERNLNYERLVDCL